MSDRVAVSDKRLPDCEGIETISWSRSRCNWLWPTRGCPTVRVLRQLHHPETSCFALPTRGCPTVRVLRPGRCRRYHVGVNPTRGCPTVRVLRHISSPPLTRSRSVTDKRLPDCEGIETLPGLLALRACWPDKRLPDCEGIETECACHMILPRPSPTRGCPTVRVLRQMQPLQLLAALRPDKRLPDCEGIETPLPPASR